MDKTQQREMQDSDLDKGVQGCWVTSQDSNQARMHCVTLHSQANSIQNNNFTIQGTVTGDENNQRTWLGWFTHYR